MTREEKIDKVVDKSPEIHSDSQGLYTVCIARATPIDPAIHNISMVCIAIQEEGGKCNPEDVLLFSTDDALELAKAIMRKVSEAHTFDLARIGAIKNRNTKGNA